MAEDSSPNYYEILQCDKSATINELKKCYQRLVLSSHPDKNNSSDDKFLQIQKAWYALKDPESRKKYDATLTCQEHSNFLLYDTIRLTDMTYDGNENIYSFSCRCGGVYLLEASNSITSKVIIGCDECSFSVQVNR